MRLLRLILKASEDKFASVQVTLGHLLYAALLAAGHGAGRPSDALVECQLSELEDRFLINPSEGGSDAENKAQRGKIAHT